MGGRGEARREGGRRGRCRRRGGGARRIARRRFVQSNTAECRALLASWLSLFRNFAFYFVCLLFVEISWVSYEKGIFLGSRNILYCIFLTLLYRFPRTRFLRAYIIYNKAIGAMLVFLMSWRRRENGRERKRAPNLAPAARALQECH